MRPLGIAKVLDPKYFIITAFYNPKAVIGKLSL